jgi:hypothetical protein
MSEFLSKEVETSRHEIVEALYLRLHEVRRTLQVRVEPGDNFDLGINCRAANEEMWLTDLIDKIERS